jgi:hypothetical protein
MRGSDMTEPKWQADAGDREPDPTAERHPLKKDPTKNDEAPTAKEQSTVGNGGLSSGADDPVMPSDDSTVNTKI